MPILNEERHLAESVTAILAQDVPCPIEVVLALGPSSDATDVVAEALHHADSRVRLVRNPSGRTPDALNAAIAASSYDVIARVDGHGILSDGYLATALRTLEDTGAANVGGIMDAEGTTDFERAVAVAMKSKLGVGGAKFKLGGAAGPAETVYLGVFRRSWLDRVGGYDARFTRAQDWEMNFRICAAGGLVWFTPDLTVTYRPRGSVRALARQYRQYGQWRRVVARRHPGSISARYLAPPAAVAAIAVGTVGGFVWRPLWVIPAGYAGAVTIGGLAISAGSPPAVRLRVPAVLATMHLTWGFGFLTSRIRIADGPSD
ncbi:glycosyltransferase family 2 protein [Flexivirga caeni]|uniref:Glycosyltransferase family 2 protein n=1 Tax=Flexivirga caeni TaxID=2294115 RepID=A0A3M9MEN8_9MICO|nr:glycosyltransferase family 2 protein [Flexivirga caeni]RNI23303.1 glycosyltransferase family 2 protein [Flexivirga caeni]